MDSAVQNGVARPGGMREAFEKRQFVDISDLKNRIENGKNEAIDPPGFDAQRAVQRLVGDGGEAEERRLRLTSVAARLQRKFGLGDQPKKRMMLYRRLEALVETHGETMVDLISEAVCCSVGKDNPGRYFARTIVLKLQERKLSTGKGNDDGTW